MQSIRVQKQHLAYWIDEVGVDSLARSLKINASTVRHWRLGLSYPRIEHMRAIRKLSQGVVGYEEIIDGDTIANKRYLSQRFNR